jgi:uncharacterized protein (DUF433 family)
MTEPEELLKRITTNPEIFGCKPIVRGHRMSVAQVLAYLAAGQTMDSLLQGFPWMEREDILACLEYASRRVDVEDAVTVS